MRKRTILKEAGFDQCVISNAGDTFGRNCQEADCMTDVCVTTVCGYASRTRTDCCQLAPPDLMSAFQITNALLAHRCVQVV